AVTFYQIGAVLHDMITRTPLFRDYDPFANLVDAVINIAPEINHAGLPPELVNLCRNCLVKDPKTRLQLVNWESFEFREFGKLDDAAKIKKRIEQAQVRKVSNGPPTKKGNLTVAQAIDNLTDWVRKECIANKNLLPAVTVNAVPGRASNAKS